MVNSEYPQTTLSRRIGVVEINTYWHFRYMYIQLAKKLTKIVSFHRDWNDLPDFLMFSVEMSNDFVSGVRIIMRAGVYPPAP